MPRPTPIPPATCERCPFHPDAQTRRYLVTFRARAGGQTRTVWLCADCVALACVDWDGDIETITEAT